MPTKVTARICRCSLAGSSATNPAKRSGEKMTRLTRWVSKKLIEASPSSEHREQRVSDAEGERERHHRGVGLDVSGLEVAQQSAHPGRHPGAPVDEHSIDEPRVHGFVERGGQR